MPASLVAQPMIPPTSSPNLLLEAQKQYPVLSKYNIGYAYTPKENAGFLEFWPKGEPGTPSAPRPSNIPLTGMGVQVLNPKTRPIDILGDVVSHYMVSNDPKVQAYYNQFASSINTAQNQILQQQYQWAVKNEGETRPYQVWLKMSGLPAMFRGYAFQQWPQDFNQKVYTPQQIQMFDEMMKYLSAPQQ